ncbi:MAG: hypothetical protein QXV46_02415 [Candidatus Bathyarchaeia archaeon]
MRESPRLQSHIHTVLKGDVKDRPIYWYIQIVPRIPVIGGFEAGSGKYINLILPEYTVKLMGNLRPIRNRILNEV